jgi:serine/threonine protein kinase
VCYKHPDNPSRCIKISKKSQAKQTKREIKYLNYLKAKGVSFSHIPEFYNVIETQDSIGMEVELVSNFDGSRALNIRHYVEENHTSEDITQLKLALKELKDNLIENNIIPCDLLMSNLLVTRLNHGIKVVLIDGFGTADAIPLANYVKFVGNRKIERKWSKFIDKFLTPCIERVTSK